MIKKILISLEFLIFSAIWGLILMKHPYPISQEILFLKIGPVILLISLIIIYSILKIKNTNFKITYADAFGLGVLAITIEYFKYSTISQFAAPFFVVMTIAGLLGKRMLWIIPFSVFIVSYCFFNIYNQNNLVIDSQLFYPLLGLALTGLLPSLLQNRSSQIIRNNSNEKKVETSINQEQPQHSTDQPNPFSAHTQQFSAEFIAELKENHEDDVEAILSSVVYFMSRNFKAYSTLAFIFEPNQRAFLLNAHHSKSQNILKKITIPLGKGIIGEVGSEKKSFMSGNLPLYRSEILYYQQSETINSLLAVPILSEQNELLGALVLDSLDKQAFRDQDKEILKRFSVLAAALINNARMRIFQEKTAKTFQLFYQASHNFSTALKQENVFDVLFNTIPLIVKCSRQLAIVFEEESRSGVVIKAAGTNPDIPLGFRFPINSGLYSFVFQKRKPVIIGDFQQYQSKYFRFQADEPQSPTLRSLAIFPIIDDENRCRGIVSIEATEPDQVTADIEQILAALFENASVAFTRAILYQHMERLATTDGLTGLNNHRHFQEMLSKELERSKRYNRPLSLLLMDIDHFKSFNDTYGHPVGDLVLKEISLCIRKSIRVNDIPARYGGEEFTVIIPETNYQGALVIAERIRTTIERHIIKSLEKQLHVTVSIGCASYPMHVQSQQELIDSADKALYYSKEHGRNRVSTYSPAMIDNGKKK